MTDKSDKSDRPSDKSAEKSDWGNAAAIAGAAIGSAALAAALMYVSRRKDKGEPPVHPEAAPETD